MTQAQQREYRSTFIKNQISWKLSQLKKLSFEELKTEFEKLMKRIESFDMRWKQKARKGINIDKTAQMRFNKEREANFGAMLKDFSRDELVELYRLVIKKYGTNTQEEMYDKVLWGDLKTMFDPPLSDDAIWSLPLQQKIINWRCLPNDAKIASRWTKDEVCYQLLKMIKKAGWDKKVIEVSTVEQ
ncbi:hypothetical protein Tco_0629007 [Tanacetum coccineum]|uniref:Uncharacterized protein n=1 Tax=Tanacetum coccineum TaxID=301880 RepID=A0ABQ4WRW3_9ASTR